ncbi:hypothetical protein NQZ68_025305 [Dissostichus eleginoides]|nr:hypothetical protein NQZ68_025305 [Dissostichus eleginoides]
MEVPQGKEGKAVSAPPGSTGSQNPSAKLPMPPEEELEQRFSAVLSPLHLVLSLHSKSPVLNGDDTLAAYKT